MATGDLYNWGLIQLATGDLYNWGLIQLATGDLYNCIVNLNENKESSPPQKSYAKLRLKLLPHLQNNFFVALFNLY
jgi:hypothetical protein